MPGPADRSRELRLRIASAAVLLPVALGGLWLGGVWWLALVAVAAAGCLVEWAGLCARAATPGLLIVGAVAVLAAGVALAWLRTQGGAAAALLLGAVWASDSGAFAAGRSFGGRLLAPSVSPGKTWSGAVGGLLTAVLAGAVIGWSAGGRPAAAGLVAGALAVVAQLGDLAESAAKRRFGVKDSGRLIPGHGGLLDRLDGLIAAAPPAALVAAIHGDWVWGR